MCRPLWLCLMSENFIQNGLNWVSERPQITQTQKDVYMTNTHTDLPTAPGPEHPNTQIHIQTHQVIKVRKHMLKTDFE